VEPSKADAVSYYMLNVHDTLAAALRNTLVIEYPKIYVMSEEQASTLLIVPKPSTPIYATAEEFAKTLGVDLSSTEQLPYARRKNWREYDNNKEGGDAKHKHGGNRDPKRRRHGGKNDGERAGRNDAHTDGAAEGNHEEDMAPKGGALAGGADSEDDGFDEDLADPELLRVIESAKSAEELLKFQAELDEQIAMHAPMHVQVGQDEDSCGSDAKRSGLTPDVTDMSIAKCL
jgi:hypothetical protein